MEEAEQCWHGAYRAYSLSSKRSSPAAMESKPPQGDIIGRVVALQFIYQEVRRKEDKFCPSTKRKVNERYSPTQLPQSLRHLLLSLCPSAQHMALYSRVASPSQRLTGLI